MPAKRVDIKKILRTPKLRKKLVEAMDRGLKWVGRDNTHPVKGDREVRAMAKGKQTVGDKRQAIIDAAAGKAGKLEELVNDLLDSLDTAIGKWASDNSGEIEKIENIIGDVNQDVADLKGEVEEIQGNLEEKFSGTERYERISELVSSLESVTELPSIESIENLDRNNLGEYVESLTELAQAAAEVVGELEGIAVE
jgi:methyl-accepting chemotaxis protein